MMETYVALDTNVLVSAQLKPQSIPGAIVRAAQVGVVVPVINDDILGEYCDVLFRRKFHLGQRAAAFLRKLFDISVSIQPAALPAGVHMPDADDAVFYATALASRAAGYATYLVTGNLRHFPQEDFIVSPRAMLDIIGQGATA